MPFPIRTALIGVSGFGATHYQDILAQHEAGRMLPVAATVINPEEEPEKCARLRALGCRLYTEHRAMLRDWAGRLDLCCIPTGIHLHEPMTRDALRAGANVLVEKPAAATVQEVAAMRAAEKQAGRFVAVGYQQTFSPETWRLKQRLLDGDIGRLLEIRCRALWPRYADYYTRNAWAGRLCLGNRWVLDSPANNALSHQVNLMCFWGGSRLAESGRPVSVQAELHRAHPIESFDTIALRVRLAEGPKLLYVVTHASETVAGPDVVLLGERGRIEWCTERIVFRLPGGTETVPCSADLRRTMMDRLLARFEDPRAPLCTLENAAAQTLCVNAAHDSSPIRPFPAGTVREVRTPEGRLQRFVPGLDEAVHRAFEEGKTFSELGLPWAAAGQPVGTTGYQWFPGGQPPEGTVDTPRPRGIASREEPPRGGRP